MPSIKTIIILGFMFSSSYLFGQKITRMVADSVCICFNNGLETDTIEDLNTLLNTCVGRSMAGHSKELFEEYNLEGFTVENIHYVQAKIIARIEKKCEVIKKLKKQQPFAL